MSMFDVVAPTGRVPNLGGGQAPALGDLNGKVIGELWDYLFRGDLMFPVVRAALRERFPDVRFVEYGSFGNTHGVDEAAVAAALPQRLREEGCDGVISAVAC